jgi:hypothetical protein
LINYDALDGQILDINVLGISIRLGILEESGNESDGFLGPTTESCFECFCLGCTTSSARESSEGNDLLVIFDVGEVSVSFGELETCSNSIVQYPSIHRHYPIPCSPVKAAATSRMFLK